MEFEFRDTPLAKRLLPTWFAHNLLLHSMELLAEDRFDYSLIKVSWITNLWLNSSD